MYSKKQRRTKKVISLIAAFAVLSSAVGTPASAASSDLDSQPVISVKSELTVPVSQPAAMAAEPVSPPAIDASVSGNQPDGGEANAVPLPDNPAAKENTGELTCQNVYDSMIALRDDAANPHYCPEGMTWTNYEPYGTKGSLGPHYEWHGGKILTNVDKGVGCAAFAFLLSDEAFGDLPARVINDVSFENVKAGDILRINGNSHSVIVLQKTAAGVLVAEGNYNKTVHWGRALSKEEVENADFMITRYPENYNPSDANAAEQIYKSGNAGNLNWTLTQSGILTISGSGDMIHFSESELPPWSEFYNRIHTVVIENGVSSIGDYAFCYPSKASGESGIISVSIPGTVSTIGTGAFKNCKNLLSATIPEGVKTVGDSAFMACKRLQHIDFPSSITALGSGAFAQCTGAVRVRFAPGSETVHIGDNLFMECYLLEDVILPEKADCISHDMFFNCRGISKLYLPAGITFETESGAGPFAGCTSLKEINFAGSESTWNAIGGIWALNQIANKPTVNFDVPFPNPFLKDPNDPGDLMSGHIHNWSSAIWKYDDNCHWHDCSVQGCPVTANNEKDGYAEHSYGSWVTDVNATAYQSGSKHRDCVVCSYRQTNSIPATGSWGSSSGSWGGSSDSWGGSWSPDSSGISETPGKPDHAADTDSPGSSSDGTDNSSDSNTTGDSSSDPDNANSTDDSSGTSDSNQKQLKSKLKKQLKTGLKQQIKSQMKAELKKELKAEKKLKTKAKLKKALKTKIKLQVKTKLKKILKKQFGKSLGKEFADLFNEQFNAQFNKVFNEQFNAQYKQLLSKQKKR